MLLADEQLITYDERGFLLIPNYFSQREVRLMKAEVPALFARQAASRILEDNGRAVRSVYGSHIGNEIFSCLTRHPRIVDPIIQILRSRIYVYQFKINKKSAFDGDLWDWHQDYIFWRNEDGLPSPRIINVALFLDDVTEFNGPMFLIPCSHKDGVIDSVAVGGDSKAAMDDKPDWVNNLTAKLKYSLDKRAVEKLAKKYGIESLKATAGSLLVFDANMVHASPNNISPFERTIVFITFNSIENLPVGQGSGRPDFLVSRDYASIVPDTDDALLRFLPTEGVEREG